MAIEEAGNEIVAGDQHQLAHGWMMSAESITHLIPPFLSSLGGRDCSGDRPMTPSSASSITALNDAELNALH
ncbi:MULTISPECIES: hypothetical protein [unclassified Bradyrhizobium]|uniref:hypothetical protein n=1 Tax=unclassified Bradyrhizobium TaxID=2631580 RepID=UPI001FF98492|nr:MULTISPECIES: hypothetical protein [unclassified Bradyrhizobium]MCK1721542.1 hypothetical protein [Bradyrhizobium sp. 141]UPK36640.1 hypothetical protein IVB18_04490 [Bradyrhizobium sp. 186]